MERKLILSFLFAFFILFISCKKTKLDGENQVLVGEWRWTSGWLEYGDETIRLDLKQKGKYKLYRHGKLIEFGRVLKKSDGYLTFVGDCLTQISLSKHDYMVGGFKITTISDSLLYIMQCTTCSDARDSSFEKVK